MKISEITIFSYDAKYALGLYSLSGGRVSTGQPSIVIRIRTDDGVEGWGESAPFGSDYLPSFFSGELAALKILGTRILGMDPRSPAAIMEAMDRVMLAGAAAKSAIDFACWDVYGKAVGLPTYTLLGGRLTEDLRVYDVIGIGSLEAGVQKALTARDRGLSALQLKVGGDPIKDAKRVRAIHEVIPSNIHIWVDANGGWNLEQALIFVRALGQNITVTLEQPCKSLSDCAEVGRRTGVPVMLDESVVTVADLFAAHAAGITGINLKPSRVGGLTKARILRDVAASLEMSIVVDDTWGGALTTAQNLQLAATTRHDRLRAVACFAEWTVPLIADVPRLQPNGCISLLDLPGNGFGVVDLKILGDPLLEMKADDS